MKKIPTLFLRENGRLTNIINPAAEWIMTEPSVPYRKWDGTCVKFKNNMWFARREVKSNQTVPSGFQLEEHDPITKKSFGWVSIFNSSFLKYFKEAIELSPYENDLYGTNYGFIPGSYELMGPKINGNPEKLDNHRLMRHAASPVLGDLTLIDYNNNPFNQLKTALTALPVEGVVWYGDEGKRVKLKRKDFDGITTQ